jgi:hypothetical protein
MIDLKIDEMYASGALNTYIDELRQWIREEEAAIEKHKFTKRMLGDLLADSGKRLDSLKEHLVKAETYLSEKKAKPA